MQLRLNESMILAEGVSNGIHEIAHPQEHLGRNHCPCGKDWNQLVQSWGEFSQEERDKKMYRMCLLCNGHIPRKKIMTAMPTNCL